MLVKLFVRKNMLNFLLGGDLEVLIFMEFTVKRGVWVVTQEKRMWVQLRFEEVDLE